MKISLFTVLLSSLVISFSSNDARGQGPNTLHDSHANKSAHDKALADFTFKDSYGGCDNALSGRWYLHFQPDGSLKFGFWGEPEGQLAYKFDDERFPLVPLGDVFTKDTRWKRVDATTLELTNSGGTHQFTIEPNYRVGNPKKSAERLTLKEKGGKKRTFEICFYSQYEDKFKVSSVFWN